MNDWWVALVLGAFTGILAFASRRFPVFGWVALAPLGVALHGGDPGVAASAAAVGGALVNSREIADSTMRVFGILASVIGAATWAAGFAAACWILPAHPSWLALALPLTTLLVHVPVRLVGAPRWHANPLASAQEPWLSVVHTSRVGGDLTPTVLLATAAAVPAMLIVDFPPDVRTTVAVGICALCVGVALMLGRRSYRAASRRVRDLPTLRVAAVVVNVAPPTDRPLRGTWPIQSADSHDVEGTLRRYDPFVQAAADQGAELIILPEVGVIVDQQSLPRWVDGVADWARSHRVTIVAPYFDVSRPKNELVVVDERGDVIHRYQKQHPVAHLEGKRDRRQVPGLVTIRRGGREILLSTVLCVDLDYGDLCAPVRRAGGLLTVPSNDWPVFDELHHRTGVWSAVMTGVSLVRATGWGISGVIDGAGCVLARACSIHAPVVLVADVPIATPRSV